MATTNLQAAQQLLDLYNAANPDLPHPATIQDIDVYENPMVGAPTEKHNTTSYLFAKEESPYFTSSVSIYYNRLDTKIATEQRIVVDDIEVWMETPYQLAEFNKLLQENYPNDELVEQEISTSISGNDDGTFHLMIMLNAIKFHPPVDGDNMFHFTLVPKVRELGMLNGELNGFV